MKLPSKEDFNWINCSSDLKHQKKTFNTRIRLCILYNYIFTFKCFYKVQINVWGNVIFLHSLKVKTHNLFNNNSTAKRSQLPTAQNFSVFFANIFPRALALPRKICKLLPRIFFVIGFISD